MMLDVIVLVVIWLCVALTAYVFWVNWPWRKF